MSHSPDFIQLWTTLIFSFDACSWLFCFEDEKVILLSSWNLLASTSYTPLAPLCLYYTSYQIDHVLIICLLTLSPYGQGPGIINLYISLFQHTAWWIIGVRYGFNDWTIAWSRYTISRKMICIEFSLVWYKETNTNLQINQCY
jgi:hypothetical protein